MTEVSHSKNVDELGTGKTEDIAEKNSLYAILDQALVCHAGVIMNGKSSVQPTAYGRDGDTLYFRSAVAAKEFLSAAAGHISICVTVLDSIVYGRSVLQFTMNYRIVEVSGQAREVIGGEAKRRGLRSILERIAPGSWEYARQPDDSELAPIAVLAVDLAEATVKIRTGGPRDAPADISRNSVWAGEVPILPPSWGEPVPAVDLSGPVRVPEHVSSRSY
ncbi:pyridoxamine 5'-phosphate oxidase family protein [Nocardia sp. NPDC048505]|uniref:pyridoxamine 5'-phosphate oxidase family protein n=1 Tax=Nocardia sp. NPDC048505 TaxID=3155756 RepID=UPI0033C5C4DA